MKGRALRERLLLLPVPEEQEARRRSWQVVLAAFEDREPIAWPTRHARPLLALAAALAVLAAALSPPGAALVGSLRDAIGRERVVGIKRSTPALFSLPSRGRLLVVSRSGPWIVQPDGSRRLLGRYREASWSPHGLFVVATRRNELAALDPRGRVRWTLGRRDVSAARWGGSRTDTRIAYVSGKTVRVVAGDGRGDRRVASAQPVAPVWHPDARRHVLAFSDAAGNVNVVDTDTGRVLWKRETSAAPPSQLEWSQDGKRLLAVSSTHAASAGRRPTRPMAAVAVFGAGGGELGSRRLRGRSVAAAFAPHGRRLALVQEYAGRTHVLLLDPDRLRAKPRRVFAGAGRFSDLAWAPDGRWLVVAWKSADQLVFVDSRRPRRIVAVSDVARQFDPGGEPRASFPELGGWCCP